MHERDLIPADMPIISLWQPWAQWVSLGWKSIETRTHHRFACLVGKRIGIHSTLRWDDWATSGTNQFVSSDQRAATSQFLKVGGEIIATAYVSEHRRLRFEDSYDAMIECLTPRWGLELVEVKMIEAVPAKGKQGIWYFSEDSPNA